MLHHGTVHRASIRLLFQDISVSKVNFALILLVLFVCMEDMFQETSACGQSLKREPSFSGVLGFVRYFFAIHIQ